MYKTFFKLRRNPFELTPDPSFLFPTRRHNEALAALLDYPWPGNIRELRNVVERAVVLAEGNIITVGELPQEWRDRPRTETPAS